MGTALSINSRMLRTLHVYAIAAEGCGEQKVVQMVLAALLLCYVAIQQQWGVGAMKARL